MKGDSLLLLLLMAGLLFVLFSRTRRQQREAQRLQSSLEVGAEVMTTAGLYATVVELPEGAVVLQTAPGQTSRWDRRAIARVLPPSDQDVEAIDDVEAAGDVEAIEDVEPTEDAEPYLARTPEPEPAQVRRSEASMHDTEGDGGDAAADVVAPSQEKPPADRV